MGQTASVRTPPLLADVRRRVVLAAFIAALSSDDSGAKAKK